MRIEVRKWDQANQGADELLQTERESAKSHEIAESAKNAGEEFKLAKQESSKNAAERKAAEERELQKFIGFAGALEGKVKSKTTKGE